MTYISNRYHENPHDPFDNNKQPLPSLSFEDKSKIYPIQICHETTLEQDSKSNEADHQGYVP